MSLLLVLLLITLPLAIYTFNYARWAWRQQLRFGAFGLLLIAIASVAVPVWVLMALS